jgi:polar amino acid transport system permease protein
MDTGFGLGELRFLLLGLQWTVLLSLVAFTGGGLAGLAVAVARTSQVRALRWTTAGYIAVFQGTPLLMQLFVVYYGLGLLGLQLPAWLAVAIAFTLNASAFLGEIWRGAIQALPDGQTEAALALGLHAIARLRHVILPQAFRIAQPATVGYLVQLIKGTSLAAIVSFIELTRAGQIVSNQTFRPLLVFGVVGAIYFVLCWPLSLYSARLEARLALASRRTILSL